MFIRRFPKEGNFRKLLLSLVKKREKDEKITFMSRKITKTTRKREAVLQIFTGQPSPKSD